MLGISPGYVSRLTRLPVLPPALEALIGDPRPLSVRVLEELAAALAGKGALDRILERWGGITPGPTPERRARQAIILAAPAAPATPAEARSGADPARPIGRAIGRLRRLSDGACVIELAAGLGDDEVEAVAGAVEGALGGVQGRGV